MGTFNRSLSSFEMKFPVVLILAGIALASAVPLHSNTLELERHVEDFDTYDMFEADKESTLDEVKEQLKERVDNILKKIREVIETGKLFQKETLEKLKELNEKLKQELGEEGFKKLRDRTGDLLRKLLENFSFRNRAAAEIITPERSADINVFEMFEELKKLVKEKFDLNKVREYIEKVFGKGSEVRETLLNWLKDKGGKQKILDFINRILGESEAHNPITDYFHKVKNYFRELNIELHEKYAQFGHWIKEQYEDAIEKGKDKSESLKLIAREFLHDTRMLSKHMAVEAKFFFTEYKNEIGDMFQDVMKKITEVLDS